MVVRFIKPLWFIVSCSYCLISGIPYWISWNVFNPLFCFIIILPNFISVLPFISKLYYQHPFCYILRLDYQILSLIDFVLAYFPWNFIVRKYFTQYFIFWLSDLICVLSKNDNQWYTEYHSTYALSLLHLKLNLVSYECYPLFHMVSLWKFTFMCFLLLLIFPEVFHSPCASVILSVYADIYTDIGHYLYIHYMGIFRGTLFAVKPVICLFFIYSICDIS